MYDALIEIMTSAVIPIKHGLAIVGEYSMTVDEARALLDHMLANGVTIEEG